MVGHLLLLTADRHSRVTVIQFIPRRQHSTKLNADLLGWLAYAVSDFVLLTPWCDSFVVRE